MATDSTPTPTAVPEHLRDLYRIIRSEAQASKRVADEHAEQVAAAAEAAKAAKLDRQWEPVLAVIREAMPPALHEYVHRPDYEPEAYFSGYNEFSGYDEGRYEYAPCVIELPGLAPIHAYTHQGLAYFYATRPECTDVGDGEYDVIWKTQSYYRGHYELFQGNPFQTAFLQASENYALFAAAEAEAARRNAIAAQPADDLTPEQEEILDAMKRDEAAGLLFNNAGHDSLAAGLLLIVHKLDRIADSLHSIDTHH